MLSSLKWHPAAQASPQPAFHRGTFTVLNPADTYLDLSTWGKGVAWVNGHCLGRFWNIGPTQTMYVPGPWLRAGENEVVILDLIGPTSPTLAGLGKPVLDQLRPELDFSRNTARYGRLALDNVKPILTSSFPQGAAVQTVSLKQPVRAKQFCLETLSAHDNKPFATVAELDLLDDAGNPIPHTIWTIAYADSEELAGEDGSASNAIDGQTANFWHSAWSGPDPKPNHPHRLVIDLGEPASIGGLRYTPRAGNNATGRIKDFAVYVADSLVRPRD